MVASTSPDRYALETTMIYTHVVAEMNKGRVVSPLDM